MKKREPLCLPLRPTTVIAEDSRSGTLVAFAGTRVDPLAIQLRLPANMIEHRRVVCVPRPLPNDRGRVFDRVQFSLWRRQHERFLTMRAYWPSFRLNRERFLNTLSSTLDSSPREGIWPLAAANAKGNFLIHGQRIKRRKREVKSAVRTRNFSHWRQERTGRKAIVSSKTITTKSASKGRRCFLASPRS